MSTNFIKREIDYNRVKVIFIGLDGATWKVINSTNKNKNLPNISELIRDGSSCVCQSFDPLISSILWTSISTGKLPDKHGVKDFYATNNTLKCKRKWEILEDYGASVGIFGHLITWPPKKSHGFIIPDLTARGSETYPSGLGFLFELTVTIREKRKMKLSKYLKYFFLCIKFGVSIKTFLLSSKIMIRKLFKCDKKMNYYWERVLKQELQSDVFVNLYKKYHPDYCYYHIHLVDACSHNFWKYLEPDVFNDVENKEIKKYKNVILEAYKKQIKLLKNY